MRPTANVSSASVSSMRVFQKRMLSGNPSRSRGPGSNSRKKSASWASKDRKPFGTILMNSWFEAGVVGVTDVPDRPKVEGGSTTGVTEGELLALGMGLGCSAKKCRKSSAKSLPVVYRSEARFDRAFRQMRS